MSTTAASRWRPLQRLAAWISDLRLAIVLLLLIAIASAIGTAIPQKESLEFYAQRYDPAPWLGLLRGDGILRLELDHVYSSHWFLALLAWLGLSLILCSIRRQWPALQASLRWIDYTTPRQLSKLAVAETRTVADPEAALAGLAERLRRRGWAVKSQDGRLAARRGLAGRLGPLLVHAGMVVLLVGAAWGALAGQRLERFLAPGNTLELMNPSGRTQVTVALEDFAIQRDPAGRPEQFSSQLRLTRAAAGDAPEQSRDATISVNHPLRYQGITLYQADWALAVIEVQLGRSPVLPLPLRPLQELGEQIWGLVLPTRPDGSEPVLLKLTSEQGPVEVYGPDGGLLAQLVPGGDPVEVKGLPIRVQAVIPASGILLKRDPGVPLVYAGFAIALLGGGLSVLNTRQLWAVSDAAAGRLHVAGLCNRNLAGLASELPGLLDGAGASPAPQPA
jgi:cytochrome c biogenesis protein